MNDVLGRIDSVLDGLCPCGAQPREGSPYCSYDCEPNYRGIHTSSDTDGTPMRWRPDLVTTVDDNDRELIHQFRRGLFNAQVFVYGHDGPPAGHLRLDDGHRFVGVDVDDPSLRGDDLNDLWNRLERELDNSRHTEAYPRTDVLVSVDEYWQLTEAEMRLVSNPAFSSWLADAVDRAEAHSLDTQVARSGVRDPRVNGSVFIASVGTSPDDRSARTEAGHLTGDGITEDVPQGWGDVPIRWGRYLTEQTVTVHLDNSTGAFAQEVIRRSFDGVAAALARVAEDYRSAFQRFEPNARAVGSPEHPMLQAIEQRRNRNTGPEQHRRAPRQISPRRAR